MTKKSILKHPYWLPPTDGRENPHYERFSRAATDCFRQWMEDYYARGYISDAEYKLT